MEGTEGSRIGEVRAWEDWDSWIWDLDVSESWGSGVSDNLGDLGKSEALKMKVGFRNEERQ